MDLTHNQPIIIFAVPKWSLLFLERAPRAKLRLITLMTLLLLLLVTMTMMMLLLDTTITTHFVTILLKNHMWNVDFGLAADYFLDPSQVQSIGKRSILCLDTTTNR